ncbi:uncharacterized protein TNCV_4943641 [Trichonephila clavipes]|nr:uncharacterized protein TNCV_4943641 [Trichonephila clavipes]
MFYPVTMTNTQQKLFERGFQTKACDQVHLEKNTYKNEYRSGVKLKPLIAPKENEEKLSKSAERKVLIRWSPTAHLISAVKKRFPSKVSAL